MANTSTAAQAVVQHLINTVSAPALPTHAPIQLETFRAELQNLLDRLQAYHWSALFPIQAKRIYGTGTHNLSNAVMSFFVDHPLLEPARTVAWTQFETLMDRYVNAGRGTTTKGTWMEGRKVREFDSDISNDQLEALVVCLLEVKADVDAACEAVVRAGSREWWVVPSPMAHFATDVATSGLGLFKFEDQSRHTMAIGATPQSSGVYYPTYTTLPESAGAPVEELVAELAIDENPWAAFLEEEEGFASTADCMSAMMEDETFFEEHHWTVVEIDVWTVPS